MPMFDLIFVSAIVIAFCIFGIVLAWGANRTRSIEQQKTPAE